MSNIIEKTAILRFDVDAKKGAKTVVELVVELEKLIGKSKELKEITADAMEAIIKATKAVAASIKATDKAIQQTGKNVKETEKATKASTKATEANAKATKEVDKLTQAKDKLAFAQSDEARDLAKVSAAVAEQNRLNKLAVKSNMEQLGSYNKISAQYSLNVRLSNAMSKAKREETQEGKDLTAVMKSQREEMKKIQSERGNDTLNVGGYEDAIRSAIGGNNQFASSLLNIEDSGEGIKGMLSSAGASVKAFGKTLWGLMKNPAFLVIAGLAAVGAAFKFWYDYNKGIAAAIKLTRQFTDLSGRDLTNLTIDIQATADMFNKDFKEVLIATNTVAKEMGITFGEALDEINKGFLVGVDSGGDFLNQLREYSTFARRAGIETNELVGLLYQFNKAGIFNDKGIDTIKEATLRLGEMNDTTVKGLAAIGLSGAEIQKQLKGGSKTMFEVIQDVAKQMLTFNENSSEYGAGLAAIFAGAGEDAGIATLKIIGLNKELGITLTRVQQLQSDLLDSQEDVSKAVANLFIMQGGFDNFTLGIKTDLNNLWTWILDSFNTIAASAQLTFNRVAGGVRLLYQLTVIEIDDLTKKAQIAGTFLANLFKPGVNATQTAIASYAEQMANYTTSIADAEKRYKDFLSFSKTSFGNRFGTDTTLDTGSEGDGNKPSTYPDPLKPRVLTDEEIERAKKAQEAKEKLIEQNIDLLQKDLEDRRNILLQNSKNEDLSFEQRAKNLADLRKLQADSFIKQINEVETLTGKTIDTNDLLQESDSLALMNKIRGLKLGEAGEQQLIEVIAEHKTSVDDLGSAYTDLGNSQVDGVAKLLELTTSEQIDEVTTKYKNAIDSLKEVKRPEQLNNESDENYELRLDAHFDFVMAKYNLEKKFGESAADLEKRLTKQKNDEIAKINKDANDEKEKEFAEHYDKIANIIAEWGDRAMQVFSSISQLQDALNERELQGLEEKYERETEALDNKLEAGVISQEEYGSKMEKLDADLAKEQSKIAREQAIREKAMAIFSIGINTAIAIMRQFADLPFPAAVASSILLGSLAIVQTAAVLATPLPKASKGMYIRGSSHANGGVNIEAEGGEVIMNKRAVSMFGSQLSAMNVATGGVPFPVQSFPTLPVHNIPDGGYALKQMRESVNTNAMSAELRALTNAILNKKTYLAIEDYRRADSKYTEVSDYGNLG